MMNQQSWSVLLSSAIAILVATPGYSIPIDITGKVNAATLAALLPPFPGEEDSGGSRNVVYAIATSNANGMNIIWRDRPLFVWSGSISLIELSDAESGELLWSQTVSPDDQCAAYTGAALQPGQTYEWMLCDRDGFPLVATVSFKVLEAEERDRITAELTEIEAIAKVESVTEEEISLQRANYFAAQELWVEVLQEAFL
jgi:hypothetical protein